MALVMTPIYTQTVGSGAPLAVTFNNIPQFYTDLKLVVSARSNQASQTFRFLTVYMNANQTSIYSSRRLTGDGSSASSSGQANDGSIFVNNVLPAASATSNTFSNVEFYIPNYAGSNFKQILIDGVSENNATTAWQQMMAALFRSTNPITSFTIEVGDFGNGFVAGSTFSLYGIIRSGA